MRAAAVGAAVGAALVALLLSHAAGAAEPLKLYAAGSLRAALGEIGKAYEAAYGTPVVAEYAASGTLRERIEAGDRPDLFASANMEHPARLAAALGTPVVLFTRNRLCALVRSDLEVTSATLLEVMLRADVRVGTSTPKADPSGDYAFALFAKAEALRPGAVAALTAKALQLTGAPDSPKAPAGRNQYAWVMAERQADLFLTYCTNAIVARLEEPSLRMIDIPEAMAVGADYGLIVTGPERPEAWRLAAFVTAPAGQRVLAAHGFTAVGLPAEP